LRELCLQLGAEMLKLGKIVNNNEEARLKLEEVLSNGKAFEKLKELVVNQGGDVNLINNPELLSISKFSHEVNVSQSGYIFEVDAEKIGIASLITGAGRETKQDSIDYGAGIILKCKVSDYVNAGDSIATLYCSDINKFEKAEEMLLSAYKIEDKKPTKENLIYKIINNEKGGY
ncbi:MAG: pyrimidine-nucleoside phosphorylase, partial [Clostridium sp.]